MEGRHCFGHLTVEENLQTGAFTRRDGRGAVAADLDMVYNYFPRLKERRLSLAGYISGGEQQMMAIGRALMSKPKMMLLDEPSMGLAPQLVEEIFEIVKRLNEEQGVSVLLAEQNTNMALKYASYGYILENGRVVMDGQCQVAARERGREGILSRRRRHRPQELPRREVLQAPQALAGVDRRAALSIMPMSDRALRPARDARSGAARAARSSTCCPISFATPWPMRRAGPRNSQGVDPARSPRARRWPGCRCCARSR